VIFVESGGATACGQKSSSRDGRVVLVVVDELVVVVVVVLVVVLVASVVVVVVVVLLVVLVARVLVVVVVLVVVGGGAQWPVASQNPSAQGVPATWKPHDGLQQESVGSHASPPAVSTMPSWHRERAAAKRDGAFPRTANVPFMCEQVAASTCAFSVALPGRPVHADQVTTIAVDRLLALIFFAVVAGQPLASVTFDPETVSASIGGPPARAMRGAVSRYRPSGQGATPRDRASTTGAACSSTATAARLSPCLMVLQGRPEVRNPRGRSRVILGSFSV
jgi:hypothetical protein